MALFNTNINKLKTKSKLCVALQNNKKKYLIKTR